MMNWSYAEVRSLPIEVYDFLIAEANREAPWLRPRPVL